MIEWIITALLTIAACVMIRRGLRTSITLPPRITKPHGKSK